MWDAVSAVAVSAAADSSLQAVTSSVQEADAWGQETGQNHHMLDSSHSVLVLKSTPVSSYNTSKPLCLSGSHDGACLAMLHLTYIGLKISNSTKLLVQECHKASIDRKGVETHETPLFL